MSASIQHLMIENNRLCAERDALRAERDVLRGQSMTLRSWLAENNDYARGWRDGASHAPDYARVYREEIVRLRDVIDQANKSKPDRVLQDEAVGRAITGGTHAV